jgi:broad-specificity NMP kinase
MGMRNYLIDGGSCTGKTTIATTLERRGHHVVHGDRVLAYQGDPQTGARVVPPPGDSAFISDHHIWDVDQVRSIIADQSREKTFFCGASRNRHAFIYLFDAVFVLAIDRPTLERRIATRVDEWGSEPAERALILALYDSGADQPAGIRIDATRPLDEIVDAILAQCR